MTNGIKDCGSTLSVFYLNKSAGPLTAHHFFAGDCSGQRFAFRVVPLKYYFPYLPLSSVPSSTAKLAKVSTEDDFKTKAS
ncbi:unnamed protein product [Clavelina lepadiformis]|uniref:Uncharacterized protein n=1 Tax=Clavelina lepadiformis TaxID=159417 RepID=A0ABP0FJH3_CLALP